MSRSARLMTDTAQIDIVRADVSSRTTMAYDEALAERIRGILEEYSGITEKKMFGGIAFMLRGHMCCGIAGDDLMLRIGVAGYQDALKRPHVRPMDFTGRPMQGYIFVDAAGLKTRDALKSWLEKALSFVRTLPAKKIASSSRRKTAPSRVRSR